MRVKCQSCCANAQKVGHIASRQTLHRDARQNRLKTGTSRWKWDGWQPYHDTLWRPFFFLKSGGIQSNAWHAILLESKWYTWPNHLSRSLMIDSKVSCPVLSRTTLFDIMTFQVIFRIFLCHLWWAASSFFVLITLMDHVSAPYSSVDKTNASYNLKSQ